MHLYFDCGGFGLGFFYYFFLFLKMGSLYPPPLPELKCSANAGESLPAPSAPSGSIKGPGNQTPRGITQFRALLTCKMNINRLGCQQ